MPKKNPGGQPTKCTPEVIAKVEQLLPTCMYMTTVADFLGIARATFWLWGRRARRELRNRKKKGYVPKRNEDKYIRFLDAQKKAMATADITLLGTIKKASQDITAVVDGKTVVVKRGEWQAAAWLEERRNPDKWGRERAELNAMRKEIEELKKSISGGGSAP